jgi:hypothetical protein
MKIIGLDNIVGSDFGLWYEAHVEDIRFSGCQRPEKVCAGNVLEVVHVQRVNAVRRPDAASTCNLLGVPCRRGLFAWEIICADGASMRRV